MGLRETLTAMPLVLACNSDADHDHAMSGIGYPTELTEPTPEELRQNTEAAIKRCGTPAAPGNYSESYNTVICADFDGDGKVDMVALDGVGAANCIEIPSGYLLYGTERKCVAAFNWFQE